ncbi:hypothetical protein [Halorientalis regularis]|jgi:hypothetical protein|uniref:Uncharacterized protein n=1 Tax=Halorientalis regularis TaxID=660518 RepID=A0A1G7FQV9_9EURY|nr:hypothetical protein [Halorientalis regularis]SDE78244.1 hypothetical protein SAMN05216218_101304 [Halorientalis regularis]
MDRRQFVRAAGTAGTLATTSLAGCLGGVLNGVTGGGGSVSEGEPAAYNAWIGASTTDGGGGIDVSSASGSILRRDWGSAQENQRIQDDALAMSVTEWAVPIGWLSQALNPEGIAKPTADGSNTDRFTLVNGTRVFEGDYDPAEIRQIQERNANQSETYEGYTLYIDGESTTAVSAEAVLYVSDGAAGVDDATARIEATIDAATDERTRFAAEYEAYDELQSALPVRGYSGVEFDPDGGVLEGDSEREFTTLQDTDLDPDVLGFAGSASIDEDDMTASVALRYPSSDAVDDRETIESELGQEADKRAIEIDGPLVIAEGEYRDLSED